MTKKNKMLTWLIPIGIAVILFLALWINQIINERQLPTEGWSRTIHPQIPSSLETPFTYKDSYGIHLYTIEKNRITQTLLDEALHIKSTKEIPTQGMAQRIIWGKDDTVIFKMNGDLYLNTNGKTTTIAKTVGDAKANNQSIVYYAQDKELHTYNLETQEHNKITSFSDPIQVVALSHSKLTVVTEDTDSNFYFYGVSVDNPQTPHEFAAFTGMSHGNISTMETSEHDGKLGLFFIAHVLRQGEHFYNYYMEFPLDKMTTGKTMIINESPITFTVENTGEYLSTPMNTQFYTKNGSPIFIFSAEGLRTLRETAINIYEGYQTKDGKWMAKRLSTSPEMSQMPFMADQKTVGWLDYISDNHFQVSFTSQNPVVINQSMHLRAQDFSHSLSNASLSLSRVFILFLLSIAYSIPTLLLYGILSFAKVELIERDSQVVKWILLGVFLISQYLLIGQTQTIAFHLFAPDFLNFEYNRWIIPSIMAILTWLLVKWVKTKDWGMVMEVFYSMIVFSIMEFFTFGPYFF